jgi:hypothetical protein
MSSVSSSFGPIAQIHGFRSGGLHARGAFEGMAQLRVLCKSARVSLRLEEGVRNGEIV